MFTGQLIWTDPCAPASPLGARPDITDGETAGAEFALLYAEALDLASQQGVGVDTGTDIEDEGGLLAAEDYGREAEAGPYSSVRRIMSHNRPAQLAPGLSSRVALPPGTEPDGRLLHPPVTSLETDVPFTPGRNSAAALNKGKLAQWMDAHALSRSSHHCAMYCRQGMEAAGLSTEDRPQSGDAGDYGPYLLRHGAQVISPESYVPQVGDTVIFNKTSQHPYGHMELYDGQQWVSDFLQHSFSPYRDAASSPPFTIYRLS